MRLIAVMIRHELALALRRPLLWIFLLVTVTYFSLYFSGGGSPAVDTGGRAATEKLHANGPYALTSWYMLMASGVSTLFVAAAMATCIVRDEKVRVEQVLRATHLSPRGYLLGKLLGHASWVLGVAVVGLFTALIADLVTARAAASGGMDNPELYGEFNILFHLSPFAFFVLPWLFFTIAGSFYLGERTRSPLMAFGALIVLYLALIMFPAIRPDFIVRLARDSLGVEWPVPPGLDRSFGQVVAARDVRTRRPRALVLQPGDPGPRPANADQSMRAGVARVPRSVADVLSVRTPAARPTRGRG